MWLIVKISVPMRECVSVGAGIPFNAAFHITHDTNRQHARVDADTFA
jgi:hypothetical protein